MCLGPMVRGRVPRHAGRNGGYRNRQVPVQGNGNQQKLCSIANLCPKIYVAGWISQAFASCPCIWWGGQDGLLNLTFHRLFPFRGPRHARSKSRWILPWSMQVLLGCQKLSLLGLSCRVWLQTQLGCDMAWRDGKWSRFISNKVIQQKCW